MKKILIKIVSYVLVLALCIGLVPRMSVYANSTSDKGKSTKEGVSLETTRDQVADIKLAVGSTKVNYSTFGTDLRNALIGYGLKDENISIESSQEQNSSTSNSFAWNSYDHSINSGTYANKYIENTNEPVQGTNEYNSKDRHIVSSNSGATMDFYGYGSSGFKDFNFLKNTQATKKTIQFTIAEGTAFDAFDGIGFFINSSVTGTYPNNEVINGYLVFFQYGTGGLGETIKLFKLDNVNTYSLHHSVKDGTFRGITTSAPSSKFGGSISLLSEASTKYGAFERRKIKIEAQPDGVKVWYHGAAAASDNSKVELNDSHLVYWPTVGTNYPLITQFDGSEYRGGFGPIASYSSHNCTKLTKMTISDLSMAADYVKSLTEIVRAPNWNSDAKSFLVNLNEAPIDDFSKDFSTAEIINRLKDDNISYIGWCGNLNIDGSKIFTESLNGGALVNVNDTATDTYQEQITAIAKAIYDELPKAGKVNTFLVNDKISFTPKGSVQLDDGKWMTKYSAISFDDAKANGEVSNYKDISKASFEAPGYYAIYHTDTPDEPLTTIKVHRKPVVDFSIQEKAGGGLIIDTTNVIDPDDGAIPSDKIKIEYRNQTAKTNWTTTIPSSITVGDIWLVSVTATDSDGESTQVVKQISKADVGVATKVSIPYSKFTLSMNNLVYPIQENVEVSDQSYGLNMGDVVTSTYAVKNSLGTTIETFTLNSSDDSRKKVIDFTNRTKYKDDTYTVTMTAVANRPGCTASDASPVISQSFELSTGFIIKYDLNGGKNGPEDQTKRNGINTVLSSTTPSRTGFVFKNWLETVPNLNKEYEPGAIFENNVNSTLKAQWMFNTPINLAWSSQTATWSAVANTPKYHVTLYNVNRTRIAEKVKEIDTDKTSYNFRNDIGIKSGEFYFTVQALKEDGNTADVLASAISSASLSIVGYTPGGKLTAGVKTQEDLDDIFGNGNVTLVDNNPLKVSVNHDFALDRTLIFEQDITINLNGFSITGPAGAEVLQSETSDIKIINSASEVGKIIAQDGDDSTTTDGIVGNVAIRSNSGNVSVFDKVNILGGNGGDSTVANGGNGGSAISTVDGSIILGNHVSAIAGVGGNGVINGGNGGLGLSSNAGNINNMGSVTGGAGGIGVAGAGGNGGNGITSSTGNTENLGTVTGGLGGNSTNAMGGNGGQGITSDAGNILNNNLGSVNGANAGSGVVGGTGGTGIVTAGNGNITNNGGIQAGMGGVGTTGNGGIGGAGATNENGNISNSGSMIGGSGGSSTDGIGGTGGTGANSVAGDIGNSGTIAGGLGGSSVTGDGGLGGSGTFTDSGNTTNEGNISAGNGGNSADAIGGNGGTALGSTSGNIEVGEAGKTTGGTGGAGTIGGNGGTGTITGADGSITNSGEIQAGIGGVGTTGNGGNGGAGATNENGDIQNSGNIIGGNGGASTDGIGGAGGAGANSQTGDIENTGTIAGGLGGSSVTGDGGIGGNGTFTDSGNTTNKGNISAGNGGNSTDAIGGNGGTALGSTSGNIEVGEAGKTTGGTGGAGTIGGNGGTGTITGADGSIKNSGEVQAGIGGAGTTGNGGIGGTGTTTENGDINNSGNIIGGNGGASTDGIGGAGGAGANSQTGDVENTGTILGGIGGAGTTGGNGGAGAITGGNGNITNDGTTSGGTGGSGTTGNGGTGGTGSTTENGDLNNNGSSTGGNGGTSDSGNGGTGGNGSVTENGDINTGDKGTSAGGTGGGSESGKPGHVGESTDSQNGEISFMIEFSASENGTITPIEKTKSRQDNAVNTLKVVKNTSQQFNIVADDGYEISDVLIDDKSVGKVEFYTFKNVEKNHSIKAVFVKTDNIELLGKDITTGDITSMSTMGLTMVGSGGVVVLTFYKAAVRRFEEAEDNVEDCFKGFRNKCKFTKFLVKQAFNEFILHKNNY